ncbi:MAG: helix-turn-helix transcriptional regulator [Actinomycetota bacterium]
MAERGSAVPAGERLRRLLVVVPYAMAHPGSTIDELGTLFGADPADLERDIGILGMTGTPPYGGGDTIDAWVDEGIVSIAMADHLRRPLRITRPEGVALYLRLTEIIGELPDDEGASLRAAAGKVLVALGPHAQAGLTDAVQIARTGAPVHAGPLRDAAAAHETVEIAYHAASTAETSTRRIDPEAVFHLHGAWYVRAWDHLRDEERLFRVDRILALTPTGDRFEPRGLGGAEEALYTAGADDVAVRLLLRPAARWVADYYVVTERVERGDDLEVTFPAGRLDWVERLLLRLGGDARVLAPMGLHERARVLAARTLARYG